MIFPRSILRALVPLVILVLTVGEAAAQPTRSPDAGDRAVSAIREAARAETAEARDAKIDEALAILEALLADPSTPIEARARSRYDRVVALRIGERYEAAIRAYEALDGDSKSLPLYVVEAAADSRLALRDPERAERLYSAILSRDPDRPDTRIARFWALLEQERFADAIDSIDALVAETADAPGSWHHVESRRIAAMARAYANRLDDAERRLAALLEANPDRAAVRRDLATVQRWRGRPNRATATLDAAAESSTNTELLRANLLADRGRLIEAGALFDRLADSAPGNVHVQRDVASWRDRRRFRVELDGLHGDSSGVQRFGSRDRGLGLRVEAPELHPGLRAYAMTRYSDATFPEGEADYDRIGIGARYRRQAHTATLELHRDRSGSADTGLVAAYDLQLGDRFSVGSRVESFSTDVPLRARGQGIEGWKAELGARWQADESDWVRVNLTRLELTDGNLRWAGLLAFGKALHRSAHHRTDGTLDLYASTAQQEGGPYFNPSRDVSAYYQVQHDWLTWRRYERSFTQRFGAGTGLYWQREFGTDPIGHLRYDHLWQFGPRWRLGYGLGLTRRVYDGDAERRLFGQFTVSGAF